MSALRVWRRIRCFFGLHDWKGGLGVTDSKCRIWLEIRICRHCLCQHRGDAARYRKVRGRDD